MCRPVPAWQLELAPQRQNRRPVARDRGQRHRVSHSEQRHRVSPPPAVVRGCAGTWDTIYETLLRAKANMVIPGTSPNPDERHIALANRRGPPRAPRCRRMAHAVAASARVARFAPLGSQLRMQSVRAPPSRVEAGPRAAYARVRAG